MQDYQNENDKLHCRFCGVLDTNTSLIISNDIKKHHTDQVKEVVFDMRDVTYICSSFIRIVIATAKKTGPDNFALRQVQPPVAKVLKIAGIDQLIGF